MRLHGIVKMLSMRIHPGMVGGSGLAALTMVYSLTVVTEVGSTGGESAKKCDVIGSVDVCRLAERVCLISGQTADTHYPRLAADSSGLYSDTDTA